MRSASILSACLLISYHLSAQVGIGTPTPNSSAMLHIESTTKGVLFPRMTAAQRNAITPVNGLMVFDTDSNSLFIYQPLPMGWKPIKGMSSLKDLVVGNAAGDVLYWNGTDWVLTPLTTIFHFYYRDKDGDGYGDKYLTVMALTQPPGYVTDNSDCNDDNPGTTALTFYRDADGDGYGNPSITVNDCTPPAGYVANPNDCNDGNAAVNPGATEVTNGIDDDCDGLIDENNATDLPDDLFQDTNGDGIDGTESAAIFVSVTGNDANPGTKSQPKRTIGAGISAAGSSTKTQVYIGHGTYNEKVILANGISLYGGYSSIDWSRNATNQAVIQGAFSTNMIGIQGNNITSATTVDRLWVTTANTSSTGAGNYGIYLSNCTALTLRFCTVRSGNAGAGVAGTTGPNGVAALNNASAGQNGSCDGLNGGGGSGGTSTCGRSGGAGGAGGAEGNNRGANGSAGIGGTPGGVGGNGCDGGCCSGCTASPGANGTNGANGGAGTNGNGGSGGVVSGGFWVGGSGASGGPGTNGNGGGGGGGGGGQGGTVVDDGGGNGGGGGGAGGCGGTGGTGGTAGGGSFGVFMVNSTGIVLTNNNITSGNGGQGGTGGNHGTGGSGAAGAAGAAVCTGEVGKGGNGGSGGNGGDGGYGGGGAGGASYAIYRSGTTVTLSGNVLTAGVGGAGGNSGGNAGIAGGSGTVF